MARTGDLGVMGERGDVGFELGILRWASPGAEVINRGGAGAFLEYCGGSPNCR